VNKDRLLQEVEKTKDVVVETMRFITAHPEIGHEEYQCAEYLQEQLSRLGFQVANQTAGLPTAFSAWLESRRRGTKIGIVALYDAVPTLDTEGRPRPNHSCGHALVAGAVIGTAAVWSALGSDLSGSLFIVGCPADEHAGRLHRSRGGGKEITAAERVWDGLDAALYAHPEDRNAVGRSSEWMVRLCGTNVGRRVSGGGLSLLLESALELGALEASEGPARIVLEAVETEGDLPSESALSLKAYLLVRGTTAKQVQQATQEIKKSVDAFHWRQVSKIQGIKPDPSMTSVVEDSFRAAGLDFDPDPPPLPYATDFGNISRRLPSAAIGVGDRAWNFHSLTGARDFVGKEAEEVALNMTRVLTLSAVSIAERSERGE
jgi:metal-dependent amidase/aminoacylase/carboxypeptidase family protein